MVIRLHILLCGLLLALSIPVIHASTINNITLTLTNSQVSFRFNSSEPFCESPPCTCDLSGLCDYTCDIYVTSPPGTILNATFLALHIPEDDTMTAINLNTGEELVRISWISLVIVPIYLDSSQMKITFDRCDGSSPYSYLEAEFSFTDQLQDLIVRSSGGAFALSDTYPSITIQSVNLSSLTDVAAQLHWFITASSYTWIQVDILDMNPGEDGEVCIFDTFDDFGEWVCMRNSVSSTTWYSYDDEIRMSFYVNGNSQLGAGLTVKLSIVDHSTWNGQFLTLAACNPNVTVQEVETIRFVTPYFNQSLENVRYQCRMSFTNGDSSQPTSLEYNHFDVPGKVSVFTVESGKFVNLADATDIKVDIYPDSPIVSISPTHELIVDVTKGKYTGTGIGMMVQPYTGDIASRGPEPMSSFGVAIELDEASYLQEFTTLGYPTLPKGDINIRWLFDKPITGTAIKVEFIDFEIGAATLFGHIAETAPPPWEFTGSTLPDDIRTETQRLTLLLRSDIECCKRGIHFNVTLITLNNECANSPCNNGGTCYDDLESFRCICPTGYIGDLCQNLITTAGSSPQTSPQSSTTDITKITTPSASTPDKTDASTRVLSTQETSTSASTAGNKSNNVLTIALSTSLVIAFLLITFLVCVVVYRSGKQARVASRTNPECCSQNDLIPANNRYQEGPPLPPDRPPEYEIIPDLKERGAYGGHYQELDRSATGGGDYVELNADKGHLPGNGVPKDPPEYFTIIPECTYVSPDRNRDSQYDYMVPMNGPTSPPPCVNPEQTTMFHK